MKLNGAGNFFTGLFLGIVMGAIVMSCFHTYFILPKVTPNRKVAICGPPAPIFSGAVNYEDFVAIRGDKIIVHGPICISFLDPNSLPEG